MKYANGYLPKIAYHMVITKDQSKVNYFAKRQQQTYGEPTPEDDDFMRSEIIRLVSISLSLSSLDSSTEQSPTARIYHVQT
jgi:hypothetical protein